MKVLGDAGGIRSIQRGYLGYDGTAPEGAGTVEVPINEVNPKRCVLKTWIHAQSRAAAASLDAGQASFTVSGGVMTVDVWREGGYLVHFTTTTGTTKTMQSVRGGFMWELIEYA